MPDIHDKNAIIITITAVCPSLCIFLFLKQNIYKIKENANLFWMDEWNPLSWKMRTDSRERNSLKLARCIMIGVMFFLTFVFWILFAPQPGFRESILDFESECGPFCLYRAHHAAVNRIRKKYNLRITAKRENSADLLARKAVSSLKEQLDDEQEGHNMLEKLHDAQKTIYMLRNEWRLIKHLQFQNSFGQRIQNHNSRLRDLPNQGSVFSDIRLAEAAANVLSARDRLEQSERIEQRGMYSRFPDISTSIYGTQAPRSLRIDRQGIPEKMYSRTISEPMVLNSQLRIPLPAVNPVIEVVPLIITIHSNRKIPVQSPSSDSTGSARVGKDVISNVKIENAGHLVVSEPTMNISKNAKSNTVGSGSSDESESIFKPPAEITGDTDAKSVPIAESADEASSESFHTNYDQGHQNFNKTAIIGQNSSNYSIQIQKEGETYKISGFQKSEGEDFVRGITHSEKSGNGEGPIKGSNSSNQAIDDDRKIFCGKPDTENRNENGGVSSHGNMTSVSSAENSVAQGARGLANNRSESSVSNFDISESTQIGWDSIPLESHPKVGGNISEFQNTIGNISSGASVFIPMPQDVPIIVRSHGDAEGGNISDLENSFGNDGSNGIDEAEPITRVGSNSKSSDSNINTVSPDHESMHDQEVGTEKGIGSERTAHAGAVNSPSVDIKKPQGESADIDKNTSSVSGSNYVSDSSPEVPSTESSDVMSSHSTDKTAKDENAGENVRSVGQDNDLDKTIVQGASGGALLVVPMGMVEHIESHSEISILLWDWMFLLCCIGLAIVLCSVISFTTFGCIWAWREPTYFLHNDVRSVMDEPMGDQLDPSQPPTSMDLVPRGSRPSSSSNQTEIGNAYHLTLESSGDSYSPGSLFQSRQGAASNILNPTQTVSPEHHQTGLSARSGSVGQIR